MFVFYEKGKQCINCYRCVDLNFPAHLHEELELLLVEDGEIEVTIAEDTKILKKGELCISLPNVVHSYRTVENSSFLMVICSCNLLPLYKHSFSTSNAEQPFLSASQIPSEVIRNLNQLYEEYRGEQSIGVITGYLYLIFSRMIPELKLSKKTQNTKMDMIDSALLYISQNYLTKLSLSEIAKALNVSPYYLSRMFSQRIGTRIDQHINELRINYADHLLEYSGKNITQIAFECGFDTIRTFNRAYKQIKGITPREFKEKST